jgi:hypothetical protein
MRGVAISLVISLHFASASTSRTNDADATAPFAGQLQLHGLAL